MYHSRQGNSQFYREEDHKTGVKIVPKPNPEKNVRMATKKATTDIIIISILFFVG